MHVHDDKRCRWIDGAPDPAFQRRRLFLVLIAVEASRVQLDFNSTVHGV